VDTEPSGETIDWSYLVDGVSFAELIEHHWSRMVWSCFKKYIPPKGRVLEIGCGSGKIVAQASRQLQTRGVGLDIRLDGLRYARGLSKYLGVDTCSFVCGNGFQLPFPDGSFDAVFSGGVIEHFTPSQTEAMVHEHVRVCRPGGRVIVSVPNALNVLRTYAILRMGKNFPAYPERGYTVWGLARLLKHCGLRPIAYAGFAPLIGLEWFIWRRLYSPWGDQLLSRIPALACLLGYECLVVGRKGDEEGT
jgi:SAM-dependent methyltransferase